IPSTDSCLALALGILGAVMLDPQNLPGLGAKCIAVVLFGISAYFGQRVIHQTATTIPRSRLLT
ncbi:MAG: hypothetical protein KGL95_07200, partial [Patescibacteria group bacterium]|nr:hypothetical protein [Patescibacteria group bacterium]